VKKILAIYMRFRWEIYYAQKCGGSMLTYIMQK
jgi:hypothetical protein